MVGIRAGREQRRRRRFSTGALLLHFLLFFVVLPLAHAADSPDDIRTAHVEAPDGRTCPPAHDHQHCLPCQNLRFALPAARVATADLFAVIQRVAAPEAPRPSQHAATPSLGSRAPPLA